MSDTPAPPIVVGTDGARRGHAAVTRAAIMASSRGAHLNVVCAHRLADSGLYRDERKLAPSDISYRVTPRQEASQIAAEGVEIASALGVSATAYVVHGGAAWALCEVASNTKADLIVVGAGRPRSRLGSLFVATVSRQLARDAPCEVIVVDQAYGPTLTLTAPKRTLAPQTGAPRRSRSRSRAA